MTGLDLRSPGGVTLALLPEVVVSVALLAVLLVVAWRHRTPRHSRLAGWVALAGLVAAFSALLALWWAGAVPAGAPHMVALDGYRFASLALLLMVSAGAILLSLDYLEREELIAPEYYALLLMAAVGAMFLAGAEDLIVLFLGLEVMSVPVYVLAGFNRRDIYSSEGALKYFLVGALASAFLLYGIALLYGATGQTSLTAIGAVLGQRGVSTLAALGTGLLLVGLGFKVASVPFHMWAPDAYDGSPTPVTAYMATGVKAAAFLALARVLLVGLPAATEVWQPLVGALAVATMIVGNLVALAQRSLKRMLAYSSIAHAGYLLAAIWPASRAGASATLLYLGAYSLTTLAAFGILAVLGRGGERDVTLSTIGGLARRRPWLAFGLAVTMFSLLGFPGTFGFIGKYAILTAVVAEHHAALAVVLVVTTLLSAGYYLPVVRVMFMKDPDDPAAHAGAVLPAAARLAVTLAVVAVLVFGVWPHLLLEGTTASAAAFAGSALDRVAGGGGP
jgi:NADH-quinone oxidoreductase subunit N